LAFATCAIAAVSPFVLVALNSAKKSEEIVQDPLSLPSSLGQLATNYGGVMENSNFDYWSSFATSLIVTVASLSLLTLFSSMAAWVLCRFKTRLSSFIFMAFVAAMVIPFQAVMLPLLSTLRALQDFTGIKFLQSIGGLVFAYMRFGGSLAIFVIHGFVKGIPYELEEAATIDGCSHEGVFFRMIFPLLRPIQVTVVILDGIWIWNDFLLPSLMPGLSGGIKTLPVAAVSFIGSYVKQWDLILSASALAMIPIIILFIFAQRQIIQGMVDGAIK
jgi:raffinose/stachyose/melibiose transport system permease protein